MAKKILILTDNSDRHYYFANKIFSAHPSNTKIILNGKGIKRSRLEIRKRQLKRPYTFIKNKILNVVYSRYGENLNADKQRVEKAYFGGERDYFQLKEIFEKFLIKIKSMSVFTTRFLIIPNLIKSQVLTKMTYYQFQL